MFTYHSAETCLETHWSRSTFFSENDGVTNQPFSAASILTDTGESHSRIAHGLASYSSLSRTAHDGGSNRQTYYNAFGIKPQGVTKSTTFAQSWSTTSTASTQAASQTSYTYGSTGSRPGGSIPPGTGLFTKDSEPDSTAESSTTTTYVKNANGVAWIETSYKFSAHSTETYVFSQTFGTYAVGTSTNSLSGTATGTRTNTATRSLSASGKTTAYLFGGAIHAQILLNTRGALPPLRPVAPALAATASITDLFLPIVAVSGSEFTWPKSLYSSELVTSTSSTSSTTGTIRTTSGYTTSSFERFSVTSFAATNVSVRNMSLAAARRVFETTSNSEIFVSMRSDSQSFYTALTYSPSGLSDTSLGETAVLVMANGVQMPHIYTTTRTGLSLNGSSASAAWTYVSSLWRLRITQSNTSTSSTLFATLGFAGAASTTTENAAQAVVESGNITTAVLGPLIPLTISSLNTVSVTLQESATSTNGFHAISFVQSSSAALESAYSTSMASSSEHQMGTAGTSPWNPVTFDESRITAYKAMRAVSLSTSSTTLQTGHTASFPATARNAKWNEAGRGDAVSVLQ